MAKKKIPTDARLRRPEPARTEPIRQAARGATPPKAQKGPRTDRDAAPNPGPAQDPEVHKVIADAVRLGYEVIGDNLRQGRIAADRFSAGAYKPRDVTADVGQLSGRLLQLARDLGTVWFDLMGAVIRDPNLHEALRPSPRPENPSPPEEISPALISVGCTVKGNSKASAGPVVLTRPSRPSPLTVAGLHSPDPSLPPIRGVSFLASDDGVSIMAVITVPPDQPPGTYSGVVCDQKTHAPLGPMTVKVAG